MPPSEAPKRNDGRHHTRPVHAHATCESAPPPITIRTCHDRGALLPGVSIPSCVLLVAARRYRPKAQKPHRARADIVELGRAPCIAARAPFRREAQPPALLPETLDRAENPCREAGGGTAQAAAATQADLRLPPMQPLVCGSHPPPPPASAQSGRMLLRASTPRIAYSMHLAPCPPPAAGKKTHAAPVQIP